MNQLLKNKCKTILTLFLTAVLLLSSAACGKSAAGQDTGSGSGTAEAKTEVGPPPALAAEVELPEEVSTMVYPVWALLLTASKDRLPYYGYPENAKDDNADAFYEPMSILTTLIEEKTEYGEGQKTDDDRYKVSEEAFSRYANALFDSYGMQEIEAPELSEEDGYAMLNDEDLYPYSFTRADLTNYEAVVIGCVKDEDNYGYELDAELRDTQNRTVLYEASFHMIPSSFEGEEEKDLFGYSICDIEDEVDYKLEEELADPEENDTDASGIETQPEDRDSGLKEIENRSTEIDKEEELQGNPDVTTSDPGREIDQDEADAKARDYSGQENPVYQGKENLEGQDYYNYTYNDEEGSSRNVLVPTDGSDPIGGTKNDDGTWSFDQ